jgi:phage/plasmid-associated DNA primase
VYIHEWLKDPNMLCYEDAGVYPPPLVCPQNVFNLWKESPYETQPFTSAEDPEIDHEAVRAFCEHINILCNRDEQARDWLFSWLAHSLQKPSEKPEHAINLIGNQGIGKSTIINVFGKLYGAGKVLETQTPERDVWGSFNSPMTNAYLVVLSETDKRNANGSDGKIKALITDYPMFINPKGKDQFEVNSYHRVVQLTNSADPTKTSNDDRRNFILRCNDELKNNREYFDKLNEHLTRPNALRSIYWSFKIFDISSWNFRQVPKTEYHQTIIDNNRNPISIFLESFVMNHITESKMELTGTELLQEFRAWRDETGYKFSDGMNEGALVKKIKLESGIPKDAVVSGKRTNKGIKQNIDIDLLKTHLGLGCMLKSKKPRLELKETVEEAVEEIEDDMRLDEDDDDC